MLRARTATPLAALLAAASVAGCAVSDPPPPEIDTVVVGPAGLPSNTVPVFCYRTLADADCFHEPVPAPPNRLIGAYLPAEEGENSTEAME